MRATSTKQNVYLQVKEYVLSQESSFTTADVMAAMPSIGRYHIRCALIRLTELKEIVRFGSGRSTFYRPSHK